MPAHIRALIVILVLAFATFTLVRRPACALGHCPDFIRRRNLWFAMTLTAFLAYNYWLYALIAALLLIATAKRDGNKPALFFSMLMVIPAGDVLIPGIGAINYFFSLNQVRILELVVLLPAFLKLRSDRDVPRFGRLATDKFLAAYLLLVFALSLRATSATDFLRVGFYLWLDILLPYVVISRSLRTLQDFREAMLAFLVASMMVASIIVFEAVRHWPLYDGVSQVLGLPQVLSLERDGVMRAYGPLQQPIAAGYAMTVAIGFYLFFFRGIAQKWLRRLGMLLLFAGLLAPLSRGPWVGAAVLAVVFVLAGPNAAKRLTLLAVSGVLALALLSVLPGGERVINLLPFIGTVETGNIDYRSQVLQNGLTVIMRHPLFGSTDFALTPEMQALKQGQGIIDIVNSYILFALQYGLMGAGLFVLVFLSAGWGVHAALRRQAEKDSDTHVLGRVLLACLAAVMTIIFTVSPISLIPILYWCLAALAVAYAQMVRRQRPAVQAA